MIAGSNMVVSVLRLRQRLLPELGIRLLDPTPVQGRLSQPPTWSSTAGANSPRVDLPDRGRKVIVIPPIPLQ